MQSSSRINMIFLHGRSKGGKSTQVERLGINHPELTTIYPGGIIREIQNPSSGLHERFRIYVDPYAASIAAGNLGIPPDDFFIS